LHFGQLRLEAWPPLFPLSGSGVDRLGADLVDEVAEFKLGLAQELGIGLGREQGSQFLESFVVSLSELLVNLSGSFGLLRWQV
jgi:hypothetical protein